MKEQKVPLPSGLEVTIRTPGPRGMKVLLGVLPTEDLLGDHDPEIEESDEQARARFNAMTPEERAKRFDQGITLVCLCATKPRYSAEVPVPPGYTDIDDLDIDDFTELVRACTALLKEAKKEADEKVGP